MKFKSHLFTLNLLIVNYHIYAQDQTPDAWFDNYQGNVQINLPENFYNRINVIKYPSSVQYDGEEFINFSVSDAQNDYFRIKNGTALNNKFIPWLLGNNVTDNRVSLIISGITSQENDYEIEPLVIFDARKYSTGTNYYNGQSIQSRSLFAWKSFTETKMLLSAQGFLGIGTSNPQAQLHTTGTIRFSGLMEGTNDFFLTADQLGNIRKLTIPENTKNAFASSSAINYNIPRFQTDATLVNSQIYDNGTHNGIGGQPQSNAKVTIYGVVNTISDERHKSNFTAINDALEKVENLKGYGYNLSDENGQYTLGLKAQEVEKVIPELVSTDEEGTKFLNYDGMVPVLIEAIKEQQQQIRALKSEIEQLKNKN